MKGHAYKDMTYTQQKQADFWYLVKMSSTKKYELPPALSVSIAMQESQFNRKALSPAGAIGLMQVMPSTGAGECGMTPAQLWDAHNNARCGLKVLATYRGSLHRSKWGKLAEAYNQGIGATLKGRTNRESRDYLKRVKETRARYWEGSTDATINGNTLELFGERFTIKPPPIGESRFQLSVYVSQPWTKHSALKVFDLYPLEEINASTYHLAKEPKESLLNADAKYHKQTGKHLPIISGFREEDHNHAVGGAQASNHKKGISIDLDFNRMTPAERTLATKLLVRHGFKPLGGMYVKNGVAQHEDNHFDYFYKEANAGAVVATLTRSSFKSDYDYARFQFLLDIARARGLNYVDIYKNA